MGSNRDVEVGDGHRAGTIQTKWWTKILDLREAKKQVSLAVPMALSNVFYLSIAMVSVMFASHLGKLEFAGSTLANSWATVTGLNFMVGLSGALDTLCGQGFGAKMYRMLGIYLQASCIVSFFFSILISILWFFTEPILVLLRQDPEISRTAGIYLKYLIPGLFAFGFLQSILRFLQAQSTVKPLVLLSLIPFGMHLGIVYYLVNRTSLGFKGAAMAASISMWISVILLAIYVVFAKKFENTWKGFSIESVYYIVGYLKLAIPSAATMCLESLAFEIVVILAGLMPNSEVTTSLAAICVNMQNIVFKVAFGLGATASTRVSNELGSGKPKLAKHAMGVTLKLTVVFVLLAVLPLAFGHDIWVGLFTGSPLIIKKFAEMTPLLVVSIALDAIQGVFSGVARGSGWQHLAVLVNLGTFYFIGTPIACVLGLKLKLYVKGLWIGLICGLFCQTSALLLITLHRKWTKIDLPKERCMDTPDVV